MQFPDGIDMKFGHKAHLNLEQYDLALEDLQAAAAADSRLPFVHFNRGLTYLKKQDYEAVPRRVPQRFRRGAGLGPEL